MKKTAIAAGTLALLATTMSPSGAWAQERRYDEDDDKKDNTAAAVVAGIAALGIGIAIASSKKKHGDDYDHNNNWDNGHYGDPFSPASNVVCVPKQRKCYERGYFSYEWTKRIYGTSAGWGGSGGSGGSWGGSGGSGSSSDLSRARRVCVDRGEQRGMRNILVESVRPEGSSRARVYMQSRRSSATVSYERWRCEYKFSNGATEFKRI